MSNEIKFPSKPKTKKEVKKKPIGLQITTTPKKDFDVYVFFKIKVLELYLDHFHIQIFINYKLEPKELKHKHQQVKLQK